MGENNESVVVLVEEGNQESGIEDLVREAGYFVSHARSVEDIAATCDGTERVPQAVVVSTKAPFSNVESIRGAAASVPEAKLLFVLQNGKGRPPQALVEALGEERVLCVSADEASSGERRSVTHFLQGRACSWASDLDLMNTPHDRASLDIGPVFPGDATAAGRLLAFVSSLSKQRSVDELLAVALNQYMELLDCEAGSIYLLDERSETLILKVASGPEKDKRQGLTQGLGEGLAGWVAQTKEAILIADVRKVPRLQGRQCTRYVDNSCVLCPILYGGRLFGVACFTMHRNGEPFGSEDLRLSQLLSDKLGATLTQLWLIEDLNRAHSRMAEWCDLSGRLALEKEAEVEAMRALSQDILESSPFSVVVYDREMDIRLANNAARAALALGQDSLGPGEAPLAGQLDLDPQEWEGKLRQVVERGSHFHLQRVRCETANGQATLDIRCSPLHGCDREVIGGILAIQDVSEAVSMEKRLVNAERLGLMGKISAQVAHEISNPLDGILRFQNLAMRFLQADPEEAKNCLEESRKGLMRMSNILSEMLALARDPAHGEESLPSVTETLRVAIGQYRMRAEENGVDIEADIQPDLPASPNSSLCGVFGNIIKNALDAMPDGGALRILARCEDDTVRVVVSDTGPGVPEQIATSIFDAFYTTKAEEGGTGLGLAWCREVLASLGGDIRLRPSAGGATFEISMPARKQEREVKYVR